MTSYERLRRIRNQHQQKRVNAILREFRQWREERAVRYYTVKRSDHA